MELRPAQTTVYLVRHGETWDNREGRFQNYEAELSEAGLAQARRLAHRIAELPASEAPEAIYTSDLRRARQTSTLIAEEIEVGITSTVLLRELDAGDWKGQLRVDVDRHSPGAFQRWFQAGGLARMPGAGGECVADVSLRTSRFWEQAVATHRGGRFLLVSHGWTLSILLAKLQGWDVHASFQEQRVRLGNTALSIVDVGATNETACRLLGCTEHLQSDGAAAPNGALRAAF